MKRKIKSLEMATVGKLLFVLVLVMSSVCAKGPLTNTLRPDEEVSVTLKVSTEHNGTTVKSLKVDLGTTRYALGQSISKNVTLGVTGLTSLSSIYASVFISKKGMSHGYGYEYGHADLTAVRTSPPSKRLLLKRPFPSPEDSQPPREVLQWFPAVDVYLSFDDAKRAVLPLGYLLLSNEYFPGGTVTSQRKLPMCCIDLSSNGTVQLRFTVNVHVSTPGEANAVLLKSNMAIGSSRMLPQSDSNDAQAILFNTSTYYLCALVILSVVHVVLTLLSIKNDISFWLSLKGNFAGTSVVNVAGYAFFSVVTTLSLADSGASSLLVLLYAVDSCVSLWKLSSVLVFRQRLAPSFLRTVCVPHVSLNKTVAVSIASKYDRAAFKLLSVFVFPAVAAYCGYTLVAVPQKGWFSWVLESLTSFGYACGFILMTPQLFINYKLKSVAHLPWRSLVYRAVNTFIDDAFSVVIAMPLVHKISCFRDDVVFLIYLYQRHIYPVDRARASDDDSGNSDNTATNDNVLNDDNSDGSDNDDDIFN